LLLGNEDQPLILWYVLQVWRRVKEVALDGGMDLVGNVVLGGNMNALTCSQWQWTTGTINGNHCFGRV
jgi:hypothetical protein